jgi:hypothetical protein
MIHLNAHGGTLRLTLHKKVDSVDIPQKEKQCMTNRLENTYHKVSKLL